MNGGELIEHLDGVADTAPKQADLAFQTQSLHGVSRTFALTIPQLPQPLRYVVSNAYLLCRIADTVEDAAELDSHTKQLFSARFVEVVSGEAGAEAFARELSALLGSETPRAERELVANAARVVRLTHGFTPVQRAALERCVRIMARGMAEFQEAPSLDGLESMADMDRYCYHVAGVVGEMLTELFCDQLTVLGPRRDTMMELGVSFGQGLQMTNILKDMWEDRTRGACWLPASVFRAHGVELGQVEAAHPPPGFSEGLNDLIGIAAEHLRNALMYTLMIPAKETGIRQFCLWALGMAVLTLRRIAHNPQFGEGAQVKISRNAVRGTVLFCSLAGKHDGVLRWGFARAAAALPKTPDTYAQSKVSQWTHA